MPSLVQLHEKYGEEGFVILAITQSDTLDAVVARSEKEKWGINYRVVQDKGGKIHTKYKIASSPTSYLINPEGMVTGGHIPTEEQAAELLKSVTLFKRPAELPKSLAKAGEAFDARAYGAVVKLAEKVAAKEDEDAAVAAELVTLVESIATSEMDKARKAAGARDFVRAAKILTKAEESFAGSDHAKTAKELSKELEAANADGWKGAELYLSLEAKLAGAKRDKDKAKFASTYRSLAKKYAGTPLADQANRRATELEQF